MFRLSNRAGIAVGNRDLGAGCKGYQQSYPNNSQRAYVYSDQWNPFAYEVEPPIPIVLHAKKYSQRQSQA